MPLSVVESPDHVRPVHEMEKDHGDTPIFSKSDADALSAERDADDTNHSVPGDIKKTEVTRPSILKRTISAKSASSWKDPGSPPDGGIRAWTMAAMGHLVIFNTWGYISSFGVFQTYYHSTLNRPPSDISWIGSVQIFLLFFIGTFSGRALDGGFFYPVFVTGAILQVIGIFMTSLCTQYWQLFLAQGICNGIANGLQFCPTMSLISTYFAKNRSIAIGIAATGSATGGLVFPAMVRQLLPSIGFGWTVRAIGFVVLGVSSLTIALLRTRLPPRKSGPVIEWAAFKETTYVLYCVGMFLNFWGLYFAFYYVGMKFPFYAHRSYASGGRIRSKHHWHQLHGFHLPSPSYERNRYTWPVDSQLLGRLDIRTFELHHPFCFRVQPRHVLLGCYQFSRRYIRLCHRVWPIRSRNTIIISSYFVEPDNGSKEGWC